jgi:hypothetical protein
MYPLNVSGFLFTQRSGELSELVCQGGKAKDVVLSLERELAKHPYQSWAAAIVRGLSRKYDMEYQVGRSIYGDCTEYITKVTWQDAVRKKPPPRPPIVHSCVPNVFTNKQGRWVAQQASHYIGSYTTEEAAVLAKLAYLSTRKKRRNARQTLATAST